MKTSVSTKCCARCKEEKPLTEFGKRKLEKDGIDYTCKLCNNIRNKKWRNNNEEYQIQYRKDNRDYLYKLIKKWSYSKQAVYEIFSNDLCLYVGKSVQYNTRVSYHKHFIKYPDKVAKHAPNKIELYNNIRSHPNVEFRIIEEASPEALLTREQHYINALRPLYNTNKT